MKKELKTELTKEKIITLAINEFGTKGYMGASLNTICSAGISKGLIYHNFKNKDALYLTCVSRCFQKLINYLKEQDIGASLQCYIDARHRFFSEQKQESKLFFEVILQPPQALAEQIREIRKEYDLFNEALYKKILETITLREGVSEIDAMQYFSVVQTVFNGYFSTPAFSGQSFPDIVGAHEENLQKVFEFMLYGIAKRRETQ